MAVVIEISGTISTDFVGIQKLYQFYEEASKHVNQTISIDFYKLNFLDGNLCALFLSMMFRLQVNNNLKFSTDHEFIRKRFSVLARNGFIKLEEAISDDQKSTVCLQYFSTKNLNEFIAYLTDDLMNHRGLNLTEAESYKIIDSLIEIATNIEIHSNTEEPFFACGQYYPENGVLKFSMVDMGNGFLPAIEAKTVGRISTDFDAIQWALKIGNTTKLNEPGGLGLSDLKNYFADNNGHLQIITGTAFWSTEFDGSKVKFQQFGASCYGTMINLLFSYN